MNEYEKRRHKFEKLKQISSFKKINNYIDDIFNDLIFQKRVLKLRSKYGIPDSGLKESDLVVVATYKKTGEEIRDLPDSVGRGIYIEAMNLSEEFGLSHLGSMTDIFYEYLVFNNRNLPLDYPPSLIRVEEIKRYWTPWGGVEDHFDVLKTTAKAYPVVIFLSPYITQTDLKKYLQTFFDSEIKPLLDKNIKAGVNIGKSRTKSIKVKERNAYIWQNRKKPIHQLTSDVNKLFESPKQPIDYSYVQKLISSERKKRSVNG